MICGIFKQTVANSWLHQSQAENTPSYADLGSGNTKAGQGDVNLDLVPDKELVKDFNYTGYSSLLENLYTENLCTDKPCPFMLIQFYMDLNQSISSSVTMCWDIHKNNLVW